MTGSAISGISHRLWLPHVAALMRATPAEALLRRMQFAVEPTQGIRVHRVGCNYILLAMAAPGAFERAMLEAFRSLFHGSGDRSAFDTWGSADERSAKALDQMFSTWALLADFINLNQNGVALADERRLDDTTSGRRHFSNSGAGLSRLKELTSFVG